MPLIAKRFECGPHERVVRISRIDESKQYSRVDEIAHQS
jgi:hypothetical protein